MEKRSVKVVGPDADGLYWVTLEVGGMSANLSARSGGIVGDVLKAFTNQPAMTSVNPADRLSSAADRIDEILASLPQQQEDGRIGAWHAVADALDQACPGWIAGNKPAMDEAVDAIKALANQASMAKLGVATIMDELQAAGWRPPVQTPTIVLARAPSWARVLLADKDSTYYWAADFAHGARFESVSGQTGGFLDLEGMHCWQIIATAEPVTKH